MRPSLSAKTLAGRLNVGNLGAYALNSRCSVAPKGSVASIIHFINPLITHIHDVASETANRLWYGDRH